MKKFNIFLKSFLLKSDAIALPRVVMLIGPMVILLLAVLGLALQLNRQLSDQQQVNINRIAHAMVRHIAQLQREHLRLYAIAARSDEQIDEEQFARQRDLVWSRLRILENPRIIDEEEVELRRLRQVYRAQWEAMQPQLARWQAGPTAQAARNELAAQMEEAEKTINAMLLVSQAHFEDRLMGWGASSQRLNGLLTGASAIFVLMMMLMTYVIYQFFRVQTRIEQGLRSSEHRLRAILDTIPDAVFRLTRTGTYIDVKPAKNFVLPTAFEDLLGKHIRDVLPMDVATILQQTMQQAFDTGQEQLCEYSLVDEATNITHDFEARILPSGTAEIQLIVRDITVDKQQEQSARQAQKLESLGVLAGGIAHDFNNLLTGMLGQASLAKMKLAKGLPLADNIDKVIVSAERAADLTRQLLAYAGKGKFQIAPLNLNQLIDETSGLMQIVLPSDVALQLALHEQLPLIEADRGQIQQVVMNLLINAVEALGEKGGSIRITTSFQPIGAVNTAQGYIIGNLPAGLYVMLQMADSGMGMDQTVLSRIFDPFFSTKPQGHGLGLSATLGIIRTHQGGLQVQSQPGRGTEFTVLFPALASAPVAEFEHIGVTSTHSEQRQTILIIDDEAAIREAADDILAGHGFTVTTADNGRTGIEQFRRLQAEVAVVLLDMKMPGMNGKQTYEVLQQIDPNLKVILTSGYSETEVNTQLGTYQALSFLPKPYSAEQLIHHVQQVLLTGSK